MDENFPYEKKKTMLHFCQTEVCVEHEPQEPPIVLKKVLSDKKSHKRMAKKLQYCRDKRIHSMNNKPNSNYHRVSNPNDGGGKKSLWSLKPGTAFSAQSRSKGSIAQKAKRKEQRQLRDQLSQ